MREPEIAAALEAVEHEIVAAAAVRQQHATERRSFLL